MSILPGTILSGIVAGVVAWMVFAGLITLLVHRTLRGRLKGGEDALTGGLVMLARGYCRGVHRLEVRGAEQIPADLPPEGLVVVANHTAGVDPLLVQAACPWRIRWIMLRDMMSPHLDWLWRRERAIAVDQDGRDRGVVREAVRHLREGGVVGIFPEGGIARPRGTVLPFMAGAGVIIARSGAPVLLLWIDGTPEVSTAWGALLRPSRSRVHVLGVVRYAPRERPDAITEDLRARLLAASGWSAAGDARSSERAVEGAGAGERR